MLRSRTIPTIAIWLFGLFGIQMLIARLTYNSVEILPAEALAQMETISANLAQAAASTTNVPGLPYIGYSFSPYHTVTMPADPGTQIMIGVLCFMLAAGMIASTLAIWTREESAEQQESRAAARVNDKIKREQRERVRRLMEKMDEEDLAALEYHLTDDGELVRKA
jgi:hypothetical protein